jgi:hypothetical protein
LATNSETVLLRYTIPSTNHHRFGSFFFGHKDLPIRHVNANMGHDHNKSSFYEH